MTNITMNRTINKPYALVNRNTGKVWRGAETRAEARMLKRDAGFKHVIVSMATRSVIR